MGRRVDVIRVTGIYGSEKGLQLIHPLPTDSRLAPTHLFLFHESFDVVLLFLTQPSILFAFCLQRLIIRYLECRVWNMSVSCTEHRTINSISRSYLFRCFNGNFCLLRIQCLCFSFLFSFQLLHLTSLCLFHQFLDNFLLISQLNLQQFPFLFLMLFDEFAPLSRLVSDNFSNVLISFDFILTEMIK